MAERLRALAAAIVVLSVQAWPLLAAPEPDRPRTVAVGAKKFTEGAVLGELMAQVLEAELPVSVERRFNLAGTQVAFEALRAGEIDLYAEYTGTALLNILHDDAPAGTPGAVFARVSETFRQRYALAWLAPFGFDNTYVLLMRRDIASKHGIRKLSDLAAVPLRYAVSHEFLQRPDGMQGLRRVYSLNEASLVGIEHDLAYRALADGAIDVTDGYSTDAKIVGNDLVALEDDRGFFPPYEAAPVVREALLDALPGVAPALSLLAGRIDEEAMRRLSHEVEAEGKSPAQAAAGFLERIGLAHGSITEERRGTSFWGLFWQRRWITLQLAGQHLLLTAVAVLAALLVGIPLGIAVSRRPRLATAAFAVAGTLQTVPSIALLAFMLPLFGIGTVPAIVALFLYGVLPILRNTVSGLRGVDRLLIEVGLGLGMRPHQLLLQVELPLAAPYILAGVRTASVISVGTATLAAFIGAGGLGDPIVTGLTVTDTNLVLSGALPAAVLALVLDAFLGAIEKLATPRGLRLASDAR